MAGKQLSIVVRTVDNATAGLRATAAQVMQVGVAADRADAKTGGWLARMGRAVVSVKGLLAGLGIAFGAARLVGSLNDASRKLDEINDAAARTGLAVEDLSRLRYVGDLVGQSFEGMVQWAQAAQKNISQFVRTGGGRAAEVIRALNIRLTDGRGRVRDFSEMLPEIAERINAIDDASRRTEIATRLFGDGRAMMLLAQGRENLARMADEASRLGVVFGPEQTAAADRYRDAVARVEHAWLGLRARVLARMAPELTDAMNRAASVIAAVPEIVENAVRLVQTALRDGPEGQGVRAAVREAVEAAAMVAEIAVRRSGGVVLAALLITTRAVLAAARSEVVAALAGFIVDVQFEAIDRAVRAAQRVGGELLGGAFVRGLENLRGTLDAMQDTVRLGVDALLATEGPLEAFNRSLRDTGRYGAMAQRAMADFRAEIGPAAAEAFDRLDALLGISAAIAKTAINGIKSPLSPAFGGEMDDATAATWRYADAVEGAKDAWAQLRAKAMDARAWGRDAVTQITEAFSGQLSSAIVDAIAGVKSFGEAMREVAGNVLRMIGEIIMRMLVMRAVMGVADAFAGGAGSAAGAGGAGAMPKAWGTPFLRSGGIAEIGGLRASSLAAAGALAMLGGGVAGIVQGARIGRDAHLAVLAAGEGVLNAAAVARIGESRVHHANAGGTLVPAGERGGVHVTIHQAVHVGAGGGGGAGGVGGGLRREDLDAVRRAAVDGVLEAMRTRPGVRDSMRGYLRG